MEGREPTIEGTIIRAPNGKFLPGTTSPKPITHENARSMAQARKEKTARLLREEWAKRGKELGLPDNAGPSHVVAAAGGQLIDEVVLNGKIRGDIRLDAWKQLGAQAELLADRRETAQNDGVTITIGENIARQLIAELMNKRNSE